MKTLDKNKMLGIIFLGIAIMALVLYANKKFFAPSKTSQPNILEETGSMEKSLNRFWWLNSGGLVSFEGETISTNLGSLPEDYRWRKLYAKSNSRDTDNGYYPQNIFRLVTRQQYKNLSQSMYFYIEKINLSESDYRNDSNGVLLFNRYQDGDNLYYTGLRVDGNAVIKKKIGGKYYTLGEKKVFESDKKYDRDNNPNLIPKQNWIGIKSEVTNVGQEAVDIKLFIDWEQKGDWQLILEVQDKNDSHGKNPFEKAGYAGIRTDFMDVRFRDYRVSEI